MKHYRNPSPVSRGAIEDDKTMPLTCCKDGEPYHDLYAAPEDCKPIDVSADPLFGRYNRTCMRFVRSLVASRGCLFGREGTGWGCCSVWRVVFVLLTGLL